VNDAEEVEAILTEPEYGFDVTKLLDEEVTRPALLRWLLEAKNSGAEQVIFYFSGHGAVNDLGTFLVTYDNEDFDEGVGLADLMGLVGSETNSTMQTLVLLDCCHSGGAVTYSPNPLSARPLARENIDKVVRQTNPAAVVMAACTADQSAYERDHLGHGLFTHHLLAALLGEAADHTGCVTAHSIYDVVSREMAAGHGHAQEPIFGGRVQGRLIVGRGFAPVLGAPRPNTEYVLVEDEARHHLDAFNELKSSYDTQTWRSEGYFAASRKLEEIAHWFERKEKIEGISRRDGFRQSKDTLIRYQSELGLVEPHMRNRWGVLERQIGSGGFGKVWRVRTDGNQYLAYKLYHAYELHDREKIKRFRNGYAAMRMLDHPAIVKVHDYSECPAGFTMDYVDGSNLRELAVGTFLDPSTILTMLVETAEAINHAHQNDVIHRDIKPENIICRMDESGVYQPFLTDFDLAWFSTQTQKATKTAMGVIYYAAPEQYIAFDPKAVRSKNATLDVFSYGQLLYFCLINRDPDPLRIDDNCGALSRELLNTCSVSAIEKIVRLYRECTAFDPQRRISSFAEILARLMDIIQELSHSDTQALISTSEYSNELMFQMTHTLPSSGSSDTFVSASGNWQVTFVWKEAIRRRGATPVLSLHVQPTRRVSLEGISNERMRKVLNRKVDQAVAGYGNRVQRHPGQRGEFEFFLDWIPVSLSRQDVLGLRRALQDIFGSLDAA
jgi:serine/threonine protein kinase